MRRLGSVVLLAAVVVTFAPPARAQRSGATLRLALVLPVTSSPLFSPDGRPLHDGQARLSSLAAAVRSLQSPELDGVPLTIAPSPLFCDEAQLFRGRAATSLRSALRDVAARAAVLSAPYAEVRLPDLASRNQMSTELSVGRSRLEACVGTAPASVLDAPGLSLDLDTIRASRELGITAVLAPADRVGREPARSRDVTFIPATSIEPGEAPNDAFVRMQSLRTAAALLPLERPDLVTFIDAIANDPRIELVGLTDVLEDPRERFVALSRTDDPPPSYERAQRRATDALRRLRSYTLPDNRLAGILRTAVARARSSAEWLGRWPIGRSRAYRIIRTIDNERRLISASEGSVTFTSQRGSVPVTVRNATTYSVRVRIALDSAKLRFPGGASRVATVEPPGEPVIFTALATSTGTFPVHIRITSPDGTVAFDEDEVTVRSTAANVPALALTAGGAAFLVIWSARHIRRRRRDLKAKT